MGPGRLTGMNAVSTTTTFLATAAAGLQWGPVD